MRTAFFLIGACVLSTACKSQPDETPTAATKATSAPSTSTGEVATSAPSAKEAPPKIEAPRPRYLRRIHPDKVAASSVYDDKKTHEKHPALDAFDGDRDTAWTEGVAGDGKGEWIEASFTKPRRVWGVVSDTGIVVTRKSFGDVFPLNAHAKSLRLVLDGADAATREVGQDEPQIAWNGIDREISTIRVVADDVWPGSKWADFGVTEIALLADASQFPSVPESIVQSEADAAHAPEDAAALLRRFGVSPPATQLDGRGVVATLRKASMVDDLGKERVLVVQLLGELDETGVRPEDDWIVFLATTPDDRLIALGSDVVSAKTKDGAPVTIDLARFHSAAMDDLVATWTSCVDPSKACHGLRAWSLERGFVERIASVSSDAEITIGEEPAPPRSIATTGLSLKLDARSFSYR